MEIVLWVAGFAESVLEVRFLKLLCCLLKSILEVGILFDWRRSDPPKRDIATICWGWVGVRRWGGLEGGCWGVAAQYRFVVHVSVRSQFRNDRVPAA